MAQQSSLTVETVATWWLTWSTTLVFLSDGTWTIPSKVRTQLLTLLSKIKTGKIVVATFDSYFNIHNWVVLTKTLLNRRSNSLESGGGILMWDCTTDELTLPSIFDAMSPIWGRGRCLIWTLSSVLSIMLMLKILPFTTFIADDRPSNSKPVEITCHNQTNIN